MYICMYIRTYFGIFQSGRRCLLETTKSIHPSKSTSQPGWPISLWKSRPKRSPTHFCKTLYTYCAYFGKIAQRLRLPTPQKTAQWAKLISSRSLWPQCRLALHGCKRYRKIRSHFSVHGKIRYRRRLFYRSLFYYIRT
jgi:hypothetical protein